MSFFNGASNLQINGGTFGWVTESPEERGWKILVENIARGTFHNSSERCDAKKCHPGTREATIQSIMTWVNDTNDPRPFLCLYGPERCGKTTIANTIADICHNSGDLIASFFLSRRTSGGSDERFLVSTIAYQFCVAIPEMRPYVGAVVDRDPAIFFRSLQVQYQELVLEPFEKAIVASDQAGFPFRRRLVIIDGLDECTTLAVQQDILCALFLSPPQFLRILVAARPQHAIQQAFQSEKDRSLMVKISLTDTYLLSARPVPPLNPNTDVSDTYSLFSSPPAQRHSVPPSQSFSSKADALLNNWRKRGSSFASPLGTSAQGYRAVRAETDVPLEPFSDFSGDGAPSPFSTNSYRTNLRLSSSAPTESAVPMRSWPRAFPISVSSVFASAASGTSTSTDVGSEACPLLEASTLIGPSMLMSDDLGLGIDLAYKYQDDMYDNCL